MKYYLSISMVDLSELALAAAASGVVLVDDVVGCGLVDDVVGCGLVVAIPNVTCCFLRLVLFTL